MSLEVVEIETRRPSGRISDILQRLVDTSKDVVTVREILGAVGDRSFGLLVFLLGIPNCIPMPPPIATICALLLLLIAIQIGLGWTAPSLPKALLAKTLPTAALARALTKVRPALLRLERFSGRRLSWDGTGGALFTALVLAVLSLGMLTAIPVVGQIPWGVAVCLLGLGLVEHDGLLCLAAIVVSAIGATVSFAAVVAVAEGFQRLF